MTIVSRLALSLAMAGSLSVAAGFSASAQTAAPAEAAKPDATKTDVAKKPSKAELGEMLKKCSQEADAKGLTVQKGKSEARKSYRRACMLKNGVSAKKS